MKNYFFLQAGHCNPIHRSRATGGGRPYDTATQRMGGPVWPPDGKMLVVGVFGDHFSDFVRRYAPVDHGEDLGHALGHAFGQGISLASCCQYSFISSTVIGPVIIYIISLA